MARNIDLRLTENTQTGIYDIGFQSNGDFELAQGFDTSLQMSIFCERRATANEVPDAQRRRGWIGNALSDTPGFEIGSKLWLFYQSRLTNNIINQVKNAAVDSLLWLIPDTFVSNIEADITGNFANGTIELRITIFAKSSQVEQRYFTLWTNTGVEN